MISVILVRKQKTKSGREKAHHNIHRDPQTGSSDTYHIGCGMSCSSWTICRPIKVPGVKPGSRTPHTAQLKNLSRRLMPPKEDTLDDDTPLAIHTRVYHQDRNKNESIEADNVSRAVQAISRGPSSPPTAGWPVQRR